MGQYRYFILFFVVLSLITITNTCQARELRIAISYDIPPYVTDNGTKGLQLEIFQKAMEQSGYSFSFLQAPFKRLELAVSEMDLDGSLSFGNTNTEGTYNSHDLLFLKNYAITKRGSGVTLNSIADLKGQHILAWQRAHKNLGLEFEQMFGPENTAAYTSKYHEIPIQKNQVDMFLKGRADVIIIDQHIFKEFLSQLSDDKDIYDNFVYHDIFPEINAFKVNFKDKKIRDDFNSGLQLLHDNGTYQSLMEHYSTRATPIVTTADLTVSP
jgi:polar amino acid transport system substrate-binding protein